MNKKIFKDECEKCNFELERKEAKPIFSESIPERNHIEQYFHCGDCMKESGDKPYTQDIEVGFTIWGIQIWCREHEANIMHISFEGGFLPSANGKEENRPDTKTDKEWKEDNK
jgi:hypothetical protein